MPKEKKKTSVWLWIVLIIVLLGVLIFGYFYFLNLYMTPVPMPDPRNGFSSNNTNSISSWKTYTNDVYGYTIKYPSTLTYIVSSDSKVTSFQSVEDKANYDECKNREGTECIMSTGISIGVDESVGTTGGDDISATLDQIVQKRISNQSLMANPQKTTLGGVSAYEGIGTGMFSYYSIICKNNDHVFDLTKMCNANPSTLLSCKTELTADEQQIIDSFTFSE